MTSRASVLKKETSQPTVADLHYRMVEVGQDVPDVDTFSKKLADPKYAENVRNFLANDVGDDVPDSATFYAKFNPQPTKQPQVEKPKSFMDYTFKDVAQQPIQFGKDVASGFAQVPRAAYDVSRDLIAAGIALPGAGLRVATRPSDYNQPTFAEEYEASRTSKDPAMQLLSDPLLYAGGKVIKGAGLGAKLLGRAASKVAPKLTAQTTKAVSPVMNLLEGMFTKQPAQTARDVEALTDPALRLADANKKLRGAMHAPISDDVMVEGVSGTHTLPEQLAQWTGRQQSATKAIAELPREQRALAEALAKSPMLARWAKTVMGSDAGKAGVAAAHGAAQGIGFDYLSRYLNRQDMPDATSLALSGGIGGAAGGLGSLLQESGLREFPGMRNPAYKIDEQAKEHIRANLPRIISEGFIPKSGKGYQIMAENKLAGLAPNYQKATESVSGNVLGSLEDYLKASKSELLDFGSEWRPVDALATKIGSAIDSKLPPKVTRKAGGFEEVEDVVMNNPQRMQARKAVKDAIDELLPNYAHKERLTAAINKSVNDAETSSDILSLMADKNSPFVKLLSAPEYSVSISGLESKIRSGLSKKLKDPDESISLVAGRSGGLELHGLMESGLSEKLTAMRAKSQAHRQGIPIKDVDELSPFELAKMRTSLTDPRVYEDPTVRTNLQMNKLMNREFRDAITDELMGIDKYRQTLGPKTAQEYALWEQLGTLAEHPGRTGLAERLHLKFLNPSVDPFRYPSASFKAGNLLQFIGEKSPIARAAWRDSSKTKSDSSKTNK